MKNFILIFLLIILIISIFVISSKKINFSKEKLSPFECGFEPFSLNRIPFSMRFFKVTLIFLIFDIEIITIIAFPISFNLNLLFICSFSFILMIIFMGLLFEWKTGSLNWVK